MRKFKLPYPVLVGRNSKIVVTYKISSLPRLVIIKRDGSVVFFNKFAKAEELKNILDGLMK